MRGGGGDHEPIARGSLRRRPPERRQRSIDLGNRRAHVGVRLEHRSEELRLDPSRKLAPCDAVDDAVDRRDLIERLAVEDHQLFLHPEREGRGLAEAGRNQCVLTP